MRSVGLALAIAAKDLRAELRSRTALVGAVAFAAMVLVTFNFARDATRLAPADLAPSALWITVAFAAKIALHRGFALEQEHGALDVLRLAPVPREAIFLGKFLANLVVVLVVEAVALPLTLVFFNVPLTGAIGGVALVLLLGSIGFVAVGTVFGAMAARTHFAELLLPLLLLPFLLPPLVGGVQATARLLEGRPLSEVAAWLRLLAVHGVVFLTVSLLLFPTVIDE